MRPGGAAADAHTHGHRNGDSHTDPHAHGHRHTDPHPHRHVHADADADCDRYCHPNPYAGASAHGEPQISPAFAHEL